MYWCYLKDMSTFYSSLRGVYDRSAASMPHIYLCPKRISPLLICSKKVMAGIKVVEESSFL